MNRWSVYLVFTLLGFVLLGGTASCNSAKTTKKKAAGKEVPVTDFQPGKVYDSVACMGHSGESYALVLPESFSPEKHYPVVFFFDAQARGDLPVKRYKTLADRFGFILVASNNSKNGLAATERNHIVYDFMADVEKRFPVDARRIYTGGFSGGARIAAGIGLSNPGIAGTIGCAAGFPPLRSIVNKQLAYVGIVGITDFNYLEMKQLTAELETAHWRHCLLVFDGHHQWPPVQTMQMAFSFLQADAMRRQLVPTNTQWIQALKKAFDQKRQQAHQHKNLLLQWQTDRQAIACLNGLADVSVYRNEVQNLLKNPELHRERALLAQLKKEEQQQQQQLSRALPTESFSWWEKALQKLARERKSAGNPARGQMVQRLYNYLSLMAYLYADGSLKNHQTKAAAKYLMIYRFVDPDNPEVYYLQAHLYAMTGEKPQKILAALQTAADKGFYDIKRFTADPLFAPLHQNPLYQKIREQVKNNPEKEM